MGVLLIITGVVAIVGGVLLMVLRRVAGGLAVLLLGLVLAITGWLSGVEVRSDSNQPVAAVPTLPLPIEATPSELR
ncbi:MAG: hypothetical protein C4346_05785 [Chloroflexota bacterium]